MRQTNNPGDNGFLHDRDEVNALTLGYYFPRACRWCGIPLIVEGTEVAAFLMCADCDGVDPLDAIAPTVVVFDQDDEPPCDCDIDECCQWCCDCHDGDQ
jgi:hypothetical protein